MHPGRIDHHRDLDGRVIRQVRNGALIVHDAGFDQAALVVHRPGNHRGAALAGGRAPFGRHVSAGQHGIYG